MVNGQCTFHKLRSCLKKSVICSNPVYMRMNSLAIKLIPSFNFYHQEQKFILHEYNFRTYILVNILIHVLAYTCMSQIVCTEHWRNVMPIVTSSKRLYKRKLFDQIRYKQILNDWLRIVCLCCEFFSIPFLSRLLVFLRLSSEGFST